MNKIVAALCVLFSLLIVGWAQAQLTTTELHGFNVESSSPATISFVGCTTDSGNLSSYTFTNHATGTAASDRKTIVSVQGRDGAVDWGWTSVTAGGSSMTEVKDSGVNFTGSLVAAGIWIIDNPSGTTSTLVVTPTEGLGAMRVCVWAAYGLLSSTPTDTEDDFQTSSANLDLSLDTPEGGVCVAAAANNTGPATTAATWAGFTERDDSNMGSAAEGGSTAADLTVATASTPLTVGADWSGTDDAIGVSACFR